MTEHTTDPITYRTKCQRTVQTLFWISEQTRTEITADSTESVVDAMDNCLAAGAQVRAENTTDETSNYTDVGSTCLFQIIQKVQSVTKIWV